MTTGLDLEAVAAAIADQLGKVVGIRQAFDHFPDRVPQVPAALVGFADVQYNRRFTVGAAQATIPIIVVVGRANEAESQRVLRRFQSHTPADANGGEFSSVKAALDADPTLGGACQTSNMSTSSSAVPVQIAQVDYLAVEFLLTVHT